MQVEQRIQAISDFNNCEYLIHKDKFYGKYFSQVPVTRHKLIIQHKGIEINYLLDFGNYNIAEIICKLKESYLPKFKIFNKSHFWKLFNKKSSILKVNSDSEEFASFIESKLKDLNLENIALKNRFEPLVIGENIGEKYTIKANYHLEFPDKLEVIQPMIELYKSLIDFELGYPLNQ